MLKVVFLNSVIMKNYKSITNFRNRANPIIIRLVYVYLVNDQADTKR